VHVHLATVSLDQISARHRVNRSVELDGQHIGCKR